MGFIADLALQTGAQATGMGLGLLMEPHEDRRQLRQQQALQDIQIAGQQKMGIFNREQAMQMWRDTNYKPQMEELKKAGLNPALMYGMSGGGGTTASTPPGNVSSGEAPKGSGSGMQGVGMGVQMAAQLKLMQAQKENIEADTANKIADTTNKPLQGENIQANTTNTKQNTLLQEAQTSIAAAAAKVQNGTIEEQIQAIVAATTAAQARATQEEAQNFITQATKEDVVKQIKAEAVGAIINNAAAKQKIQVDKAQIQKWSTELSQGWEGLDIRAKEIRIQAFKAQLDAKNPGLFNVLGGVLMGAMDEISDLTTGRDERYMQEKKVDLKTK